MGNQPLIQVRHQPLIQIRHQPLVPRCDRGSSPMSSPPEGPKEEADDYLRLGSGAARRGSEWRMSKSGPSGSSAASEAGVGTRRAAVPSGVGTQRRHRGRLQEPAVDAPRHWKRRRDLPEQVERGRWKRRLPTICLPTACLVVACLVAICLAAICLVVALFRYMGPLKFSRRLRENATKVSARGSQGGAEPRRCRLRRQRVGRLPPSRPCCCQVGSS